MPTPPCELCQGSGQVEAGRPLHTARYQEDGPLIWESYPCPRCQTEPDPPPRDGAILALFNPHTNQWHVPPSPTP